ncbi:MAG: peptide-methionine (R)-S-oxide reductase MsrB [Opitutaceae bacterium]
MKTGTWIFASVAIVLVVAGFVFFRAQAKPVVKETAAAEIEPLNLTEEQWRERLSPEAFEILREEGTERPGSSPLNEEKREGMFVCAGCGLELFPSKYKFESGTGWPSFYEVIEGHVETKLDRSAFMTRTEYHCARCGGHQGHVFNDGPPPTGLRYCNNGDALRFVPKGETASAP